MRVTRRYLEVIMPPTMEVIAGVVVVPKTISAKVMEEDDEGQRRIQQRLLYILADDVDTESGERV
jgi:hypothetical protein